MLVKDEHFRNYYKKPVIIKNKEFSHQVGQSLEIDGIMEDDITSEELAERLNSIEIADEINAILAIPYIDHTAGISFFTLSTASLNGNDVVITKRVKFDAMSVFRKNDVNESEFEYLENLNVNDDFNMADYEEFAGIVEGYFVNEHVEALRFIDILDSARNENFPDDLNVFFVKEGLQTEGMWVRCENLTEDNRIEATLLNTPYQDFDITHGDTVKVFPYKTEEGEWVVICDLNMD